MRVLAVDPAIRHTGDAVVEGDGREEKVGLGTGMRQTGKQDLDEALASPGTLAKQLGDWERRQRVKTWVHASSALLFFIGMGVTLWLLFEEPSKATEAGGAAIAFGLIGIIQGILALSSRAQCRAMSATKKALEAKDNTSN